MDASSNMSGMSMSMDTTTSLFSPHHNAATPSGTTTNRNFCHSITKASNSDIWDLEEARENLRMATIILANMGLKLASRWAAEQLNSLVHTGISKRKDMKASPYAEYLMPGNDIEIYAKSIFDLGEYRRCAGILSRSPEGVDENGDTILSPTGKKRIGNKGGDLIIQPPRDDLTSYGTYLRAYALYMAGERRKEEEVLELRDPLERTAMKNENLPYLVTELQEMYNDKKLDAFGIYMYGVALKEMEKTPVKVKFAGGHRSTIYRGGERTVFAHEMFAESILEFPYNWSAWLDLAELCVSNPSIDQEVEESLKPINSHWMYYFFRAHVFMKNQNEEKAIIFIERLIDGNDEIDKLGFFISSTYLLAELAVAYAELRDYDTAQEHFQLLESKDPQNLDQMDVYSNVLFVKEDKVTLSTLAHRAMKLDKYRVETCIIVGNYYSLKGQHQKAVQYFQRALKLDRSYCYAWTLLGHAYMEMLNTSAAIESYRRAVDINPNDYRAWYGLGQLYEMMDMFLYSLHYYRKAVEVKPYDARMWCAMGTCYLALDRRDDAIKSFDRAVTNGDTEGVATMKLASLFKEDGDNERAAKCYVRHLDLRYQAQLEHSKVDGVPEGGNSLRTTIMNVNVDEPEAEGLLFLALYYRDNHQFDMAMMCCKRLLDYPGPEKEEGKMLQKEIQVVMDKQRRGVEHSKDGSFIFSP